ncbi:MAG: hypothetical protein ACJ8F7_16685 [Gemmataceae bacterium]
MLRRILSPHESFAAVSLVVVAALAPASATDAPLIGRPRDYFFGAIGERVRVEMTAVPTDVRVEDELTLTISIRGASNPGEIQRPDLAQLDEFASRFHTDDISDGPDPALSRGERSFRYRLRPKTESVKDIPPLLFRYWQPRLQYFATTAPDSAIMLTVRPRVPAESAGMPMQEPEFLFQVAKESAVLAPRPEAHDTVYTVLALLLPAIVCGAWYIWWRLRDPNAAALAQLRRTAVVRGALDEIQRVRGPADAATAGRLGRAILGYLRERFGLAASISTPAEVTTALLRVGLPAENLRRVETLLRECNAVQFGPSGSTSETLAGEARQLILLLEEATWPAMAS